MVSRKGLIPWGSQGLQLVPLPPGTSLLGVWTWVFAGQEEQEGREADWLLLTQQA